MTLIANTGNKTRFFIILSPFSYSYERFICGRGRQNASMPLHISEPLACCHSEQSLTHPGSKHQLVELILSADGLVQNFVFKITHQRNEWHWNDHVTQGYHFSQLSLLFFQAMTTVKSLHLHNENLLKHKICNAQLCIVLWT